MLDCGSFFIFFLGCVTLLSLFLPLNERIASLNDQPPPIHTLEPTDRHPAHLAKALNVLKDNGTQVPLRVDKDKIRTADMIWSSTNSQL